MSPRISRRKASPLGVMRLEDRTVPASTITVTVGGNGSGSLDAFLFDATPGTISSADGGSVPGTLSTGALAAVSSTTDISVTAQNGITFNDLGGTLSLQTAAGRTATLNAQGGALTFANVSNTLSTAGGGLALAASTSETLGQLSTSGGNLNLTALGGSLTQTGTANAGSGAVSVVAAGNLTVDALTGFLVGLQSNGGAINSAGANPIVATSQLGLSANIGITVNTRAASIQASNLTTGNISITQAAAPAQALTTAGTGVRNQAPGGFVTLTNLGDAISVAAGAPVQTSNGAITLAALDFNLAGPVNSGTARTTLTNSTGFRQIDLGTNTAGRIGLTQAELNNVTAGVLRVGSATAGITTVAAAITAPASWNTLSLVSGSTITQSPTTSLTVANLAVSSPLATLFLPQNNIGTVAASVGSFTLDTNSSLVIGSVDGLTGITATAGNVFLFANTFDVQQPINAGTGELQIATVTAGAQVSLGTEVAGQVSLTDTELGRVTAGLLRVGTPNSNTGSIAINSAITRHAGYNTLALGTGGTLTQTAALSVANLLVRSVGAVTLTNAGNDVDTLAAQVTGSGNGFSFADADAVSVGTIGGFVGITTNAGPVTLISGGSVTDGNDAAVNVTATNLTVNAVTLVDLDTDVGTLSIGMTGAAGTILLTEAATATISSLNPGTGTITLDGGTFNLGNNNVISGSSTLIVTGATLNLGAFVQSVTGVQLGSGSITGTGTLSSTTNFDLRSGLVSARLGGSVGLNKTTSGTATLSGANTYTGATIVNSGTLLINGSQAAGSGVTVNNGGTLGGTGTVAAAVTVFPGGTLAPGLSPGIISTGSLTFTTGSTFAVEVNSPYAAGGTDYDRTNVTGTVALNNATLSLVGGAVSPAAVTVLTIINNDGTDAVSGSFAGLGPGSTVTVGSFVATISYTGGDGNDVTLTTVTSADLSVVKTGPSTVVAGATVTYTITVTNNGPGAGQNVTLRDPVPSSVTALFPEQLSGPPFSLNMNFTTGVFTATAASMAAGASATFVMTVRANSNATGTLSNTATVNSSTPDVNGGNNTSTSTANITTSADVAVVKTGPATVVAGNPVSYTITVTNAGPSDAQNVILTDAVPANATFVSQTQTAGPTFNAFNPPAGGTGTTTLSIVTLAAGATATFTIVDRVNSGVAGGTIVTNTAAVNSTTADPAAANNSSAVTTTVQAPPAGAPPVVTIDNDTGQRSMVRSLRVAFSGVVSFIGPAANAFQLARTGPGAPAGNVTLAVDLSGSTASQTIARLTFSGALTEGSAAAPSLIDGNYTLTVFSSQINGGLPGGDSVTALHRYYGDINGDRAVNGLDLGLFRTAFGTSLGNPNYVDSLDENGDGAVNGLDLGVFRTHFGTTLP